MYHMYNYHYGFMPVIWIAVIGIAVLAILIFIKPNNENPNNILKKRYAKGEISREEYDKNVASKDGVLNQV